MKKDYTLIIVDNDQDDHRFIIRGLKQANYNFNYARVYGGEELLALLLKKDLHKDSKVINPDFILLDINMPKFSGFQYTKDAQLRGALALLKATRAIVSPR